MNIFYLLLYHSFELFFQLFGGPQNKSKYMVTRHMLRRHMLRRQLLRKMRQMLRDNCSATNAPATFAPTTNAPATFAPATNVPATFAPTTNAPNLRQMIQRHLLRR